VKAQGAKIIISVKS